MEKSWLRNYDDGVPEEVDYSDHSSLAALINKSLKSHASKPAFTCMGKTLSFGDLDEKSRQLSKYFAHELRLQKGDRIAIMMPNVLQYPIAIAAALRLGLIVVNVNPLYTPRELEHQLNDSGAKAILVLENFATTLEQVLPRVKVEHVMVTSLGELLGFPKSLIVNFVVKRIKKMVPDYHISSAVSFSECLRRGGRNLNLKNQRYSSRTLRFFNILVGRQESQKVPS